MKRRRDSERRPSASPPAQEHAPPAAAIAGGALDPSAAAASMQSLMGNRAVASMLSGGPDAWGLAPDGGGGEVAGGQRDAPPTGAGPGNVDASGLRVHVSRKGISGASMTGLFGYAQYHCERLFDPEDLKRGPDGRWKLEGLVHVEMIPKVNSNTGRINVSGPDSPVITDEDIEVDGQKKKVWEQARDDLTPGPGPMHRTPRVRFWSGALVAQHELYHRDDLGGWAETEGADAVREALEGYHVSGRVGAAGVIDAADDFMKNAIDQYYSGLAIEPTKRAALPDFALRAGEHRAFADGQDEYAALAAGIEARGRRLEAED